MTEPLIILGCGPAGLLAAHAARLAEVECLIFSKKNKSRIGGAQYLHKDIPGLTDLIEPTVMRTIKIGDRHEYARKVYGNGEAPVSWDNYPEGHSMIYNMHQAYDWLWDQFEKDIADMPVLPSWVGQMSNHPIVSSIPMKDLCTGAHNFESQKVYIDYRETGEPGNWIVYNGRTEDSWYRGSRLFGWESWEYSESTARASISIEKPLRTNCDCFKDTSVRLVGRYGKWEKSQLVHNAFEDTLNYIQELA